MFIRNRKKKLQKKLTNSNILNQKSPFSSQKAPSNVSNKDENTPDNRNQEFYYNSDDDTLRKVRKNLNKFPKYQDRISIFGNKSKDPPESTKNRRDSFSDCAHRVMSQSLKIIGAQKEQWFPSKKLTQVDKIKIEETRCKRSYTLDKCERMHDVVETLDDLEHESDSEEMSSKFERKASNENDSPKIYAKSENNDSIDLKNDSALMNDEVFELTKTEAEQRISVAEKMTASLRERSPRHIGLKDNLPIIGLFALDQAREEKKAEDDSKIKNEPVVGSNNSLANNVMEKSTSFKDKSEPVVVGSHSTLGTKAMEKSTSFKDKKEPVSNSTLGDKAMSFKDKNEPEARSDSSLGNKVMEKSTSKPQMTVSNSSIDNKQSKSFCSLANRVNGKKDQPEDRKQEDGGETPKRDIKDLSIKTDSSSDELSSDDNGRPTESNVQNPQASLNTPQNSVLSFKYVRSMQRKSVNIENSSLFQKMTKRDSISISKKEMNDMGVNLTILKLGNNIKVNKNRINYTDILKGLLEMFIRNSGVWDQASLRSNLLR